MRIVQITKILIRPTIIQIILITQILITIVQIILIKNTNNNSTIYTNYKKY